MNLKKTLQITATTGLITCMSVLVGCSAGGAAGDESGSGASESGFNISGEISALWEKTNFISTAHAGESVNPLAALSEMCNSQCSDDTCATLIATAGEVSTDICSGDANGSAYKISMADGAQAVMAALQDTYVFSVKTAYLNEDGVVVTKAAVLSVSEDDSDASLPVNDDTTSEQGLLMTLLPDAANPGEAKGQLDEIKNGLGLGSLIVAFSEALGNKDVSEQDAKAGLVKLGLAKTVFKAIVDHIKAMGENFNLADMKLAIAANQELINNITSAVSNYQSKLPKGDADSGSDSASDSDSSSGDGKDCKSAAECAGGGNYVDPVTAAGFTVQKTPVDMYTTAEAFLDAAGVTAATCTHSWNPELMASTGSCEVNYGNASSYCSYNSLESQYGSISCRISAYSALGIDTTQLQASLDMMMNGGGGAASAPPPK